MNLLSNFPLFAAISYFSFASAGASGKEIMVIMPDITNPSGKPIEMIVDTVKKSEVGASSFNPVVFKNVKDYNEFKFLQLEYISKNYEGFEVVGDSLSINEGNRIIHNLMLKDDEGSYIHIYFDADDIYRKYRKIDDKKLAERVKLLLKSEKSDSRKSGRKIKP